eukprot:4961315-Alexandrium_andersonii.AAC.1
MKVLPNAQRAPPLGHCGRAETEFPAMELYPVSCAFGRPLVATARSVPNDAPPSRAKFRRHARGYGCG